MASLVAEQHATEVQGGQRFEFGKNWQRFLSTLNDERIALAERSLQNLLGLERLDGKTFLDVGSGSGLFSLTARRLGAKVRSFDYDPQSVACTAELRRRYFPDDPDWTVEQGSVLDKAYLASLGTFDIVYSWGVLHHTGAMWTALDNVKPLVRMGGLLYIAIYNELGAVTDMWRRVKRMYNSLPGPLRLPYASFIIAASEARTLLGYLRRGDVGGYVRTWTDYQRLSTRGMSRWHDWIDWIGGYPYECASIDAIVDVYAKDGFALSKVEDRSSGYGCNEFVFRREAPLGTLIDCQAPSSRSFARRFGRRLPGPFSRSASGWTASVPGLPHQGPDEQLFLFRDNTLVGPATLIATDPAAIIVGPRDAPDPASQPATYYVAAGRIRILPGPFKRPRRYMWGHMWIASVPDLAHLADDAVGREFGSTAFLFEDEHQLPFPHSIHSDIVAYGKGRFSHWRDRFFFAALDNADPNHSGRTYRILYRDKA